MLNRSLAAGVGATALLAAAGAHADSSAEPRSGVQYAQLETAGETAPDAVMDAEIGAATDTSTDADADASPSAASEAELYIEADEFFNDQENGRQIARGDVEARYGGRLLRADEATYYPDTGRLVATGNIVVFMEDGSIDYAQSADFSEDFGEGVAVEFSMRMANDATVASAYLERRDNGAQNILTRAVYTACPVCEEDPTPTWRFEARKALHDREDQMIYYRDVTFKVAGVPVLYSPYFAHADPSVRRKSGLLMPRIGYSTTNGFRYEQPYFWAISPYEDLTLRPVFNSDVAPLLGLEFRRQFYSGYLQLDGSITKEQRFDTDRNKFGDNQLRGHLFGTGVFAIDEDWSWGFGIERASDVEYLYRYNLVGAGVLRGLHGQQEYSGYLASQLYVAGQDENFYSSVATVDFQSLFQVGVNDKLPVLLPLAEYRRGIDLDGYGRLELVSDVSVLYRQDGLDYARGSGQADWRARHVTDVGVVLEPFARARTDFYRIDDAFDTAGAPLSGERARGYGYGGVDITYPFYRPGKVGLLFEPRLQLAAAEGTAAVLEDFFTGFGTPLQEDSLTAELNGSNLFTPNRYAGFDVVEEGLQANMGVKLRADWPEVGSGSIFAGRSYHTDTALFSPQSGLDTKWSDYLLETEINTKWVGTTARLRIDPEEYQVERLEATGFARVGPAEVTAAYFNVAGSFTGGASAEYLRLGGNLALSENFSVFFSMDRDLLAARTQQKNFGVTYQDDCLILTVSYVKNQGSISRAVQQFGGVFVSLGLKTIGQFGIG